MPMVPRARSAAPRAGHCSQ
ncbi:hypothetical protein A2U01_0104152, partial [Trifolium medium]|nr:hypothetical protein [Trifolium medium]